MALPVIIAFALLQATATLQILPLAGQSPRQTPNLDKKSELPTVKEVRQRKSVGWALPKSALNPQTDVEDQAQCGAQNEFFSETLQPFLPKEFFKPMVTNEYKPLSLLQTEETQSSDYTIPSFEFVNEPFGRATQESSSHGKSQDEATEQSFLQEKELMAQVLGPKSRNVPALRASRLPIENFQVWSTYDQHEPERAACAGKQLKEAGVSLVHRFQTALHFPDTCKQQTDQALVVSCLAEHGFGDCVRSGISSSFKTLEQWCGHKRLFEELAEDPSKAEYFIVVSDNVVLHREAFMPAIMDFVSGTQDTLDWDLVQLDPFGAKNKADIVKNFHGKPIFSLKNKDAQCREYWGFHTVLIKKDALPRILRWMSTVTPMSMDMLPKKMPNVLAYSSLVSRSVEDAGAYGSIQVPSFCSEEILKSTQQLPQNFAQPDDFPELPGQIPTIQESVAAKKLWQEQENPEASVNHWTELMERANDLHEAAQSNFKTVQESFRKSRAELDNFERRLTAQNRSIHIAETELAQLQAEADESEEGAPSDMGHVRNDHVLKEAERKLADATKKLETMEVTHERKKAEVAEKLEEVAKHQLTLGATESFGKTLMGPKTFSDPEETSIIQLGETPPQKDSQTTLKKDLDDELVDLHGEMHKLNMGLPANLRQKGDDKDGKADQAWQTRMERARQVQALRQRRSAYYKQPAFRATPRSAHKTPLKRPMGGALHHPRGPVFSAIQEEEEGPHFQFDQQALHDLQGKFKFPALYKALQDKQAREKSAAKIKMDF